ncbi:hypothetical protein CfE428DRAFT_5916 [Chthoniobacter flavus Ellin428]|uniref:Uncharacterized protein n=1 Tax=Chthoniobacter flavus Ellin428 TaxID=497964 RepID=B4DAH5_9BACT|nr:hypothetical protein CfE428DRAFT_5916 [Chthoniobacter flavus Ellin428]
MWPESGHLHDAADGALLDQLPGTHRALHMQALAEVDHVLLAGGLHLFASSGQLSQGGERGLVREIVLAGVHHSQTQRSTLARHGGAGDEQDLGLL